MIHGKIPLPITYHPLAIVTTEDTLETATAEFQAGKLAFERGEYRKSLQHLETVRSLVNLNSRLGGEVQIWLVTVYEALGQRTEAIALCKQINHHPDWQTRKQSKRLLYILEAPRLVTRPEWLIQIPDLANLTDRDTEQRGKVSTAVASKRSTPAPRPAFQLEPSDPSQVKTQDNRFLWFALVLTLLVLGASLWLA
jgi:tetratricopeptide (TPR) repeat protein